MVEIKRVAIVLFLSFVWPVDGQSNDFDDNACGRQQVSLEGLIKNGVQSRPGEWPWHVAVFHRIGASEDFDYQCGGTLIHKYLVLTAAHCVTLRSSRKHKARGDVLVKVGRYDISQKYEEQGRNHEVSQIVTHRDHNPLTYENDIALVKLQVPVIFTRYVQPICLWKRDDGVKLPEIFGQLGTVVGWGLTENNTLASTLNKAQMPVVTIWQCLESDRTFFGRLIYAKSFCAGFKNGTGVCNGDSGGGMYFRHEQQLGKQQWYLRGVVSFSNVVDVTRVCNLKKYVGFTDAGLYLEWIYENAPINENTDPVLGHPNVRLINQGDCGKNEYFFGYQENKKPIIMQYPWMTALRHPFQNGQYVPCNGVLINRNYILTTTCVDFNDEVSVTLGDYNTGEVTDCDRRYDTAFCLDPVQTTTIAEYFRKDRLVLARLQSPAIISLREHIQAICLPTTLEQRSRIYPKYILTGWKESGNDSLLLQRAELDFIGPDACRTEMANLTYLSEEERNITSAIICVRNERKTNRSPSCDDYQPGSTGQVVEKKSNRYLLYGVQTGISYCSKPETFIAISEYMVWVLDNMRP